MINSYERILNSGSSILEPELFIQQWNVTDHNLHSAMKLEICGKTDFSFVKKNLGMIIFEDNGHMLQSLIKPGFNMSY